AMMQQHQKAACGFAGNMAWAPVLSQGLANKGFARASQARAPVDDMAIKRIQDQVASSFDPKAGGFRSGGGVGGGVGTGRGGLGRGGPVASGPAPGGGARA